MLVKQLKSLGRVALAFSLKGSFFLRFGRLGGLTGPTGALQGAPVGEESANWLSFCANSLGSIELTEPASEDLEPRRLGLLLLGGGFGVHSVALMTGGSEAPRRSLCKAQWNVLQGFVSLRKCRPTT